MQFSFSYFTYPQMTSDIGRFKVYQKHNCLKDFDCDPGTNERLVEIPAGNCTEAKIAQDKEYWGSRIPGFEDLVDYFQCTQEEDMIL